MKRVTAPNPALLPSPALFDVTAIAKKSVEGSLERFALEQIELAPNARRDISNEGIDRLAAMLMRTGQLVPCIGHRPDPKQGVAEVAEMLKLNQQTVRNWIFSPERGGLPCGDWIRGRCVDVPSRRSLRRVRL
jgi:hypothetical protein